MMYHPSSPTCTAVQLCRALITALRAAGQANAGANLAPPGVINRGY